MPADSPADLDLELLRKTAAGDAAAFEELVERHQGRVLGVCERMLGDREDARDAAQEVFLKVYRKAGRFRPRARVTTWLYRIAVNHCLNQLRRRKVARFFSLGDPSPDGVEGRETPGVVRLDPVDPAPGLDVALEARRRWAATRAAIDGLPSSQRAVVVLAKFEGLSYDEIADVLGITTGSVASRLFRGMRRLEKALGEAAPAPQGSGGSRVS